MGRLQSPDIRDVRVGLRKTSISVETEVWVRLRVIAFQRGILLCRLMDEINRKYRLRRAVPGRRRVSSLSSAVRVFVLHHSPFRG
jgi:predicted DNA-binding ribbon-helix-helix protein